MSPRVKIVSSYKKVSDTHVIAEKHLIAENVPSSFADLIVDFLNDTKPYTDSDRYEIVEEFP